MTAIITGATSGIGYAFAYLLAKKGYDLVLVGRKENILIEMKESIELENKIKVDYILCDLTNNEQLDNLVEKVKNIDAYMFINNAGFDISGEFSLVDDKYINEMIQVNVIAFTRILKPIITRMKENKVNGKILNLASIASQLVMPYSAVYSGTKSYVYSLSFALYEEYKRYGITVTTLCPGPTVTNFAKRASLDDSRMFSNNLTMNAGEVAKEGYEALMKNKIIAIPGFKNKLYLFLARLISKRELADICGKISVKDEYHLMLEKSVNDEE